MKTELRQISVKEATAGGTVATSIVQPEIAKSSPVIVHEIGGVSTFIHNQSSASTSWEITHNLHTFPSVTVVDSAGTVVNGDIEYNSDIKITLTFSAAFSGKAYLN